MVEYDPGWVREFVRSERELRDATGPLFARIEHIGSTSVPGLAAKPVIDMATVAHPDDVTPHLPELTGTPDSWRTRNERLRRDHLRAHPDLAVRYAR